MRLLLLLFLPLLFISSSAFGEALSDGKEGAGLQRLSWLQGKWTGVETGAPNNSRSRFEESWTDAAGGIMIGMGKEIEKEIEKDKLSFLNI